MDDEARRAKGLAVYKEMGWGENEGVKELDPDLWKFIPDVLFGEIWSRPGLSLRECERSFSAHSWRPRPTVSRSICATRITSASASTRLKR